MAVSTNESTVNPDVYRLSQEEFAFFSGQIGITDEEELKNHIVSVVDRAYKIFRYRCVRDFLFLRIGITSLPAYPRLLALSRERKDLIMLDIGCCFGVDVRKVIQEGFPAQNVIASDLRPEFWDLGHALFRSTPESFPVAFIPGDAFDDSFINLSAAPTTGDISLATVRKSLNPLKGHIAVIHAAYLFHLFGEQEQVELACRLGALLSPEPGSMILGGQRGSEVAGNAANPVRGKTIYRHSPESWRSLWDGVVFPRGTVAVECELSETPQPHKLTPSESALLFWSVTRI